MKSIQGICFLLMLTPVLSAQISMIKTDDGILITDSGENVFQYQIKPKNLNGEYERNNYIHPLWGIDGAILTEDFPADHLHHRGIFWAWHQIIIDGERIGDGWELKNFKQKVTDVEFSLKEKGEAVLKTEVEWKSDRWKNEKPYLKENTIITVYPKKNNFRKIDFKIKLLALEENLKIGSSEDAKGYSGFSVRMDLPDDVKFTGPDGEITPEITAVKSGGYVNVSGSIGENNTVGGIVIVDNSDNPDYPQLWILRAKNSMQNAAYPGRETILISTTKPLVLNYSLIVYKGKLNNRMILNLVE